MEIFRSHSANKFEYGVTNSGNGPALVKFAVVKNNEKAIQYWHDIPNLENFTQSYISNRTISSQRTVTPILHRGDNADTYLAADQLVSIEL
ncbi:hypothetical protein [Thalassotalea atypica]|uniref:hypothetical protein n=1 Tax=Thalassotalea atypica TaxID=2054316 RepID=UPI0025723F36|nr:hypothetical protein [Thalassotalea atypica]